MSRKLVCFSAVFLAFSILSHNAFGQCQGGGRGQSSGSGVPMQSFANAFQNPGFSQFPQYNQMANMQQPAMQQQLQRAIYQQQQYRLLKAQEREAARLRRLTAANAKREKEAKQRTEQRSQLEVATRTNSK